METDKTEVENMLYYWMIGLIFSFIFMFVWLYQGQRNGELTLDKTGNIVAGCLFMSFVWPLASVIVTIAYGSAFLFWFIQKVVKVKDV